MSGFKAARGEFNISGFRNHDLRQIMKDKTGGQMSRMLKRLRLHGLIKKIGRTYKYYLTRLGRKVVLTVSRLFRRKGIDRSIEAMVEVAGRVPNVMYLVAGDGPEREYLEGLVREHGLAGRVRFLGHVPEEELRRLDAVCDCFLMPSRQLPGGDVEGFGIVFLEAGACGAVSYTHLTLPTN